MKGHPCCFEMQPAGDVREGWLPGGPYLARLLLDTGLARLAEPGPFRSN